MSLLLYSIADCTLAAAPGGVGVDGRPLEAVGADGLVAVVSEHERQPELSEASLWAFEDAIEAQMSDHAVLPARFGTVFEHEQDLDAILRDRRSELTAKFERIRGAVELGVRATWPEAETDTTPTGPNAGSAYMLARVARDTQARELAAQLDAKLGHIARATSYRVLIRPTVPVTASYLVDRERTEEFVTRVRELESKLGAAQLVCTGPWPPYSFVGEESHD